MPLWGGAYIWFCGFYLLLVAYILAFRIPSAIERGKDSITIHFVLRKLNVPIKEIEEIRVVRKWMVKDSMKLAARAAPSACNPCIPKSIQYDEINVSKHAAKRACPFCCCDPPDVDTKFFWGAPGMWGREVCIVSIQGSIFGNYAFDLKDGDGFIADNKADYSNITATSPELTPQRIGAPVLPEDAGLIAPGAFSPMMSSTAQPVIGIVSPLDEVAANGNGYRTPEKGKRKQSKDFMSDLSTIQEMQKIQKAFDDDDDDKGQDAGQDTDGTRH